MKFKKDYLTIAEIGTIINQMANFDNSWERELIKTVFVYIYCVGELNGQIIPQDMTLGEMSDIYNAIAEQGFIGEGLYQIKNLDTLDDCIYQEFGLTGTIKNFLEGINDKIDGALKNSNINISKALTQLQEMNNNDSNN